MGARSYRGTAAIMGFRNFGCKRRAAKPAERLKYAVWRNTNRQASDESSKDGRSRRRTMRTTARVIQDRAAAPANPRFRRAPRLVPEAAIPFRESAQSLNAFCLVLPWPIYPKRLQSHKHHPVHTSFAD